MRAILLVYLVALKIAISSGFIVDNFEWNSFKTEYGKWYDNSMIEMNHRMWYSVNLIGIGLHNSRYELGLESFKLGVNQFSDLTVLQYAARFPPTFNVVSNGIPYTPPAATPLPSFSYLKQGFVSAVRNQGYRCSSGWAYAVATVLQIFYGSTTGDLNSPALSPQNLIDCAGGVTACRNQVPQTALDYLTRLFQKVFPQTEYPNNAFGGQGMCALPVSSTNGKSLRSYASIPDGSDELLKSALNFVAPVVVKINPASFEFMHYKEGIFTQPKPIKESAHYITIMGYEDATGTNKGTWIAQNSFGSTWGEAGMMRIEMNPAKSITKSAVFPLE